MIVLKDSIEFSSSPLHYDSFSKLNSRDLAFKFTEIIEDDDIADEYANEYGFIVN